VTDENRAQLVSAHLEDYREISCERIGDKTPIGEYLQLVCDSHDVPHGETTSLDINNTNDYEAAPTRFVSGWKWLCVNKQGRLVVDNTGNQDSPLTAASTSGKQPILGLLAWEHVYYLTYENRGPEYIAAFYYVCFTTSSTGLKWRADMRRRVLDRCRYTSENRCATGHNATVVLYRLSA
jgi:hypothetical protein